MYHISGDVWLGSHSMPIASDKRGTAITISLAAYLAAFCWASYSA